MVPICTKGYWLAIKIKLSLVAKCMEWEDTVWSKKRQSLKDKYGRLALCRCYKRVGTGMDSWLLGVGKGVVGQESGFDNACHIYVLKY